MRPWLALGLLVVIVAGCGGSPSTTPTRIALLAPFEGRYREVGYQALYAARLGIADSNRLDINLLPIDDGGSVAAAQDRAAALNQDPLVKAVIVLGPFATAERVSEQLQKPTVSVGTWEASSITELATQRTPSICGDACLLPSFVALASDPTRITIETRSPPVTAAFRERYLASGDFVPEPLPTAQHVYLRMPDIIAVALGETLPAPELPQHTYTYDRTGQLRSR